MIDLLIIGSGPTGLYSAFLGYMHKLNVVIIDASNTYGGQMLLYKDKPVYDMPGHLNVNGKKVLESIYDQFCLTGIKIKFNEKVTEVKGDFPKFIVKTTNNEYIAKTIIFASGGGHFEPIKMGLSDEEKYNNINYSVDNAEKYKNKDVIIFGGGDSAVDWAHYLMNKTKKTYLVHRRDVFRSQEKLLDEIRENVHVLTPYKPKQLFGSTEVKKILIENVKTKKSLSLEVDEVLVFFGQKKTVNKEEDFHLKKEGKMFKVNSNMETNRTGIFAVGNVAFYEGKINMLSVGFGEAATAVGSVVYKVFPGKKMTYIIK